MPIALILPFLLNNMPAIIKIGQAGVQFILHVRQAAQQTGEWTTDLESSFVASLIADAAGPEWQPDAVARN